MVSQVHQSQNDLKQLSGVKQLACGTTEVVSHVYNATKSKLPANLQQQVNNVESTVSQYTTPYITSVSDQSDRLLHHVDDRVDKMAHSVAAYQPELTSKFGQAKNSALHLVNDAVGTLKSKGVFGLAHEAAGEVNKKFHDVAPFVSAKTEQILEIAEKSVEKVVNYPPVQQAYEHYAKPVVNWTWDKYAYLHDQVVATTIYHRVFDVSHNVFVTVANQPLVKNTAHTVYPLVAPVADPVVNKVTNTDYYKLAVEQLQPRHATA